MRISAQIDLLVDIEAGDEFDHLAAGGRLRPIILDADQRTVVAGRRMVAGGRRHLAGDLARGFDQGADFSAGMRSSGMVPPF